MPSNNRLKTMNTIHRLVQGITRGKVGWSLGKMPVLELTTKGRKSGLPHKVMLTSPLQENNAIVIVASRGGDDFHPAWFLNLRDNPQVEVAYAGQPKKKMTARVATASERERMWPQVTARYKGYAGYQTKTTREIPLVILSEG
ncbi:MAG: nitroreductase/quinone reductase family protein [Ilumatobacteraceae bacterium]